MNSDRRFNEFSLWANLATLFPLFVWKSAYDSFHEPKWCLLALGVGGLLLIRALQNGSIFHPRTPLEWPICLCLFATLIAWRWDAADRWIGFTFWLRLILVYLLFRLWVSGFAPIDSEKREGDSTFDLVLAVLLGAGLVLKEWVLVSQAWGPTQVWSLLVLACLLLRWGIQHVILRDAYPTNESIHRLLDAFLVSGAGIALLTVIQDWGIARWSEQPVSDWRFHLSSTLGNPNEVGGFLSYLLPAILSRIWTSKTRAQLLLWISIGILYLYGLTTVFTVGAWLGLFVVLPISGLLFATGRKKGWLLSVLSLALFILLQGSLRLPSESLIRTVFLLGGGAFALFLTWLGFKSWENRKGHLVTLMVGGLLGVWCFLLLPWGIPNHPRGLIEEAVSSPRWKGGFGARQFIWRTTGLMVKDHPIRGIGWGHYYFLHADYQGALYSSTEKPHDRPTVGLVPQVHSDPLQVLAEAGFLGSVAFLWLGAAAFTLGLKKASRCRAPEKIGLFWMAWTGLGLIAFHSAVDFPLRQPQPALLAVFFLATLCALDLPIRRSRPEGVPLRFVCILLATLFVVMGTFGFRDQVRIKSGFETFLRATALPDSDFRQGELLKSANLLEGVRYPLPETQDKWLYLARVHLTLGDLEKAHASLEEARKYRHSLALYQTWKDYGQAIRSPKIILDSIRGMIRYNPNWAGYHKEAADLWRILGDSEKAREEERLAEKFRVR